jgi:HK97 family phage portal protein
MSETGRAAASGWFGPLAPLAPIAPKDVAGRSFDFPSGYNIATKPRSFEPITVEDLRALAETYDLLRLVIETRKDQIERLPWTLRVRAGKTGPGAARLDELTRFFERPDGEHDFALWLRMLLEDLFVLDAPTLWRQRRRNGELFALHPLDGATIKRVIDDWGRTPQPFEQGGALVYPTAYQQILKGYPAIDYSTRDIIYAPRNLRPGRVYGLSPVEQIVMTVCTALKRQTFTLTHFTEGNIPESLIGVPENWTPDQIKNFQDYWDAYFTGDLAARRRAKFVPGGVAKTFIQTKEPELKGAFDEWLARIVCYAFSVSPQAFVAQINRSTGETHKEMAEEEGLRPILNWVKRLIDRVLIEDFGESAVEFVFGQDERIDPSEQAQILSAYVGVGILTRNEARAKLGLAPVEDSVANELTMTTAAGATPVATALEQNFVKYDQNQPRDGRGRWTREAGGTTPAEP